MTTTPRIAKTAPERRTEILDAAEKLFTTQGVEATSIEHILNEVGIARGTLYYHFKSKHDILRALVSRTTDRMISRAEAIAQQPAPAPQKFLAVMSAARASEQELELAERLHTNGNAEFHVLSIVEAVTKFTPMLTEIVEQGIAEGTFHTEHPREAVEILLTAAGMLLDGGIFIGQDAELPRRTAGLVHAAEILLGCEPGSFAPIIEANS